MKTSRFTPWLALVALLVLCFGLGARIDLVEQRATDAKSFNQGVLASLLGDSRRLFANQFFVKADSYFHSGYYPSIFDNNEAFRTAHVAADAGAVEENNSGDAHSWMGKPTDWIDRFRRNFIPSEHTHLDGLPPADSHSGDGPTADDAEDHSADDVREILPWLKLSAEMDPSRVETYVAGSYWLRKKMNRPKEAEEFLRDGLRANPRSYAITYELARIYAENLHNPERARNLFKLALRYWTESQANQPDPDKFMLEQILGQYAMLERREGDKDKAIDLFQQLRKISPHPEGVDKLISDTEAGNPIPGDAQPTTQEPGGSQEK